jgi:hypothetical protein
MKNLQQLTEVVALVFRRIAGNNTYTIQPPTTPAANQVLSLPDATDTVVARATTDSLSNKTFSDAITMAQITTPSNPASGFDKVYVKSDNNLYKLDSTGTETQVGAGGGGLTVAYQASSFTATASKNYLVNTSGGAVTATLPSGSTGATIQFVDDAGSWLTNNLTITPASGQSIQGLAANSSLICDVPNAFVQMSWDNTNSYWTVISGH